jgi:predicted enzyme related to lactoylglutathione lyase
MATEAGGAIVSSTGSEGPVVYFGVDDLEGSIERVKQLGGRVVGEPRELSTVGAYVQCVDTAQNPFSLWQAA